MGIFSDMIRGIISEELKAMAAEDAAASGADNSGADGAADIAGADNGKADDDKDTKETPSEDKAGDDVKNDDNMRQMLRKELRAFMAENLNGEEAEGEMPTADDALRSILGFAEKE